MGASSREEIVEVFDALDHDADRLCGLSFDVLTTPERLAALERVERVARRMNLSLEDAQEFVRKFDHERRALLEAVFEYDLFDWKNFDLVINTAALETEDAADMIVLATKRLAPRYDQEKMRAVLSNLAFAKRVESAVKKQVETLYSQDIVVTADDQGVVVLRGLVADPRSKALAGEAAAKVEGVTRVVNNLTTTQYSV